MSHHRGHGHVKTPTTWWGWAWLMLAGFFGMIIWIFANIATYSAPGGRHGR